jgi:hypothetical protein
MNELSDTKIRNAKPADKEYTLADGQNPRDISVEWRVMRRARFCMQPHDPPPHAQRLQKCRQLALHSLFVEFARIDAGGLETIEVSQRHTE